MVVNPVVRGVPDYTGKNPKNIYKEAPMRAEKTRDDKTRRNKKQKFKKFQNGYNSSTTDDKDDTDDKDVIIWMIRTGGREPTTLGLADGRGVHTCA